MSGDEDDETPDNLVVVSFRADETSVEERWQAGEKYCIHRNYQLKVASRTVVCADCKALLDPFQLLLEMARKQRNWRDWDKEARTQRAALTELHAEETKVKARLRNAKRKDADAAVEEERRRTMEHRRIVKRTADEIGALAKRIAKLQGVVLEGGEDDA